MQGKRQFTTSLKKKNRTQLYAAYKRFTVDVRKQHNLKVQGRKKVLHANENEKKAGVAIFMSDKRD